MTDRGTRDQELRLEAVWDELERPGPDRVTVAGVELRAGSRVRLHPRAGGDVFDLALTGRMAVVEGLDTDLDDNVKVAVAVDDDPGRELGMLRQPGHRFFFALDEVEPVPDDDTPDASTGRILVAGVGNVFLGDDGFGVEVAARLAGRRLPGGVHVEDFGIRGMDLAYALQDDYDAAIFVDAVPRGEPPGTLFVIEPEVDRVDGVPEAHGMDPVKVLALARELGGLPRRVLVVGCEPKTRMSGDDEELVMELSEPVKAVLDDAVRLVESLVEELATEGGEEGEGGQNG